MKLWTYCWYEYQKDGNQYSHPFENNQAPFIYSSDRMIIVNKAVADFLDLVESELGHYRDELEAYESGDYWNSTLTTARQFNIDRAKFRIKAFESFSSIIMTKKLMEEDYYEHEFGDGWKVAVELSEMRNLKED